MVPIGFTGPRILLVSVLGLMQLLKNSENWIFLVVFLCLERNMKPSIEHYKYRIKMTCSAEPALLSS